MYFTCITNPHRKPRASRAGEARLRYDPQRDNMVQDTVRRQCEEFAAREEREEAAKRQKYERLTTLKGLTKEEFRDMRLWLNYSLPRTASSTFFRR
jgi:hypothetical protein